MSTIIRGTTPTVTFKVNSNLDLTEIAELWITFRSGVHYEEKTFTKDDVTIDAVEKTICAERGSSQHL